MSSERNARSVLQVSEAVIVEFINLARIDYPVGHVFPMLAVGEEVGIGDGFDFLQQSLNQSIVASYGDTLIFIVEIIVVEDQSYGQPFDDKRR